MLSGFSLRTFSALPIFFIVKILSGLLLLKISSVFLPISDFAIFSQFLLFGAVLNMVSVGGVQNGLVRQIAANPSPAVRAELIFAAFIIWIIVFIIVGGPIHVFREYVSSLLIGDGSGARIVSLIMVAVFVSGPAQLFGAHLTGCNRAPVNLLAQAIGLLAATTACAFLLYRGQPMAAACAFYWGMTLSVPMSWAFSRSHLKFPRFDFDTLLRHASRLVHYSVAFLAVVGVSGITLFGLRYAYQEAFGLDKLSYWLVAQRVSDTSTQLLGLYMTQFFLPVFAGSTAGAVDHTIIRRSWFIASGAMAAILAGFAVAPNLVVSIFLSDKYIPAVSLIMLYMIGDVLRVTASLAMHAAFAREKLLRYVAIETFAMLLFSIITLSLIYYNNEAAPFVAYISAFGGVAIIIISLYTYQRLLKVT